MRSGRGSVANGAAALAAGQAASQALAFVRSILIARLLSTHDVGIGATFALTVALLDMMSNTSVDKQLVQARDGDEPRFQAAAHAVLSLRGLLGGAALVLLAWPTAMLFGIPDAWWAFACLAWIPVLKGLSHLDTVRVQREFRFAPGVWAELIPQIVVTLTATPLLLWLGDYTALLWLTVLQSACALAGTHLLARRSYRWRFDPALTRRMLGFGWPLLVNGLLLWGIMQGDRLLVGSAYGLSTLGVYSVVFTLTLMPTLVLARISSAVMLPVMARVSTLRGEFARRYQACSSGLALAAGGVAVLFIACGDPLVRLIYGEAYAGMGAVIAWLAAMQAIRLLRSAPSTAAMSLGDTRNMMLANVVRSCALLAAVPLALMRVDLAWLAAAAFGGEVLAYASAVLRLSRRHGVSPDAALRPALGLALGLATAAALTPAPAVPGALRESCLACAAGWLVTLLAVRTLMGSFRALRDLARLTTASPVVEPTP